MTPAGFPHSGIPGSKAVCASPGLIAACRALRRLPMPRHPPCALGIFIPGPLSGCFSPFPHGTGSLSVIGECSALEGGPPCFAPDFTCPALLGCRLARGTGVRVRGLHPVPPAFPCRSAPPSLCNRAAGIRALRRAAPQPPCSNAPALHACTGLGWSAFARRYSRNLG